jgi:predicted HNH restriction endonuclease
VRELRPTTKKKRLDRIERKQSIKEKIIAVMGGKCMLCDGIYPPGVYDFHHVFDKEHTPSDLFKWISAKRIAAELSKCALLCANCHRLEHIRLRAPPVAHHVSS